VWRAWYSGAGGVAFSRGRRVMFMWQALLSRGAKQEFKGGLAPLSSGGWWPVRVAGVPFSCGRLSILVVQAWHSRAAGVAFSCGRRCFLVVPSQSLRATWPLKLWLAAAFSCGRRSILVWQAWYSRVACAVFSRGGRGILAWQALFSRVAGVVFSCGRRGVLVWQSWYSGVAGVVL
jgi:hypothetical protein